MEALEEIQRGILSNDWNLVISGYSKLAKKNNIKNTPVVEEVYQEVQYEEVLEEPEPVEQVEVQPKKRGRPKKPKELTAAELHEKAQGKPARTEQYRPPTGPNKFRDTGELRNPSDKLLYEGAIRAERHRKQYKGVDATCWSCDRHFKNVNPAFVTKGTFRCDGCSAT